MVDAAGVDANDLADQVAADVRAVLGALDPEAPVYDVRSLEASVDHALAPSRDLASLLTILAGFAFLLAVVGLYGVVAYAARQSRRSVAIRMALGADRGRVWRMLMRDNLGPLVGGIVLGLLLAFGISGTLSGLLFGIESTDPLVYAILSTVVFLLGVLTVAIPARRLGELEPARVLRDE